MIKTNKLLNALGRQFPKKIAKEYHDYVGLMTGKLPKNIDKILLCLDCDWKLLPTIKEIKPDIIITHHPFIYGNKKKVFKFDKLKERLCFELEKLNIPVYSFHTNFDAGNGGMNDALAIKLGLKSIYTPESCNMMRIGELDDQLSIFEFANYAKKCFDVDYSLLIANSNANIKKIGIIGGGGSGYWTIAKKEQCDIFISGDAPHHIRRDIVNYDFAYLDMPHEIEKIFIPTMKKILLNLDNTLKIYEIDHEKLPVVI